MKMSTPAILVLIGAVLSAVGGFWAASRQQRAAIAAAEQRSEFERELRAKSDEIAALNRQIASSVTGGDSYPYVDVIQENGEFVVLLQ